MPPSVVAVGFGSCVDAATPLMSENAGWEAVGTPLVEIWRIHWLVTAAKLWTPPRVLAEGLGRSAPTRDRNVGAEAAPVDGPAHIRFADCVFRVAVRVPVLTTGLFVMVKIPGIERPTLDTVPPPADTQEVLPAPSVIRTLFSEPFVTGRLNTVLVPAAALAPIVTDPDVAPLSVIAPPVPPLAPRVGCDVVPQDVVRFSTVPGVLPKALSNNEVPETNPGKPVEAEGLPQI